MNVIAMIPARIGSTRLKMKNLALLGGHPLISYAIKAAKNSRCFNRIVVNSDHEVFRGVAAHFGADFYLRPKSLGSSTTKSDAVVADFMHQFPSDILVWVNSIAPLQTGAEVRRAVQYFRVHDLDSLMCVKNEQVHAVFKGRPINFRLDEEFARTQDLVPVQAFVYSLMMWRCKTFLKAHHQRGYALLSGKVGYFPASKYASIIIKTQEDLAIAQSLLRYTQGEAPPLRYYTKVSRASIRKK